MWLRLQTALVDTANDFTGLFTSYGAPSSNSLSLHGSQCSGAGHHLHLRSVVRPPFFDSPSNTTPSTSVAHTEMDPVAPQSGYTWPPPGTTYLSHGFAAHVYVTLDGKFVIKRPKTFAGCENSWDMFRHLVDNERKIYEHLGVHDGLITYHGYDEDSGSIQLDCASDGDLTDFLNNNPKPDEKTRSEMVRHLVNTLRFIYSRNVVIQDIKTDNVLMHHGTPKICDFTEAILYSPGGKTQDVSPTEGLKIDLLGIGCVIWSISAWEIFNYDFYDERRWPTSNDLRQTTNVKFGSVIENCWYGKYTSIEDFQNDVACVGQE